MDHLSNATSDIQFLKSSVNCMNHSTSKLQEIHTQLMGVTATLNQMHLSTYLKPNSESKEIHSFKENFRNKEVEVKDTKETKANLYMEETLQDASGLRNYKEKHPMPSSYKQTSPDGMIASVKSTNSNKLLHDIKTMTFNKSSPGSE